MLELPGYSLPLRLYLSPTSVIYRGWQGVEQQPVIVKVLNKEYPTPTDLARFRREYEITRQLSALPGVIEARALIPHDHTLVMILEDIGAESLQIHLQQRGFTLEEVMALAIQLSTILSDVHQQQVMHKDINPANIILNRMRGEMRLIDFGISTYLSRERPMAQNPTLMEGTLPYMSPEQSGRMNCAVDYRTDFYSLGATLYELLTGQPPFQAASPMGLLHAHLAQAPTPPHQHRPEIPPMLSAIVLKLLAKAPDERYQSAYGLRVDLERVQAAPQQHFALGEKDQPSTFQIPEKLYGREGERQALFGAFQRVCQGSMELLMVSGYAGIGKTTLIQEIQRPLVQAHGYFATGKFDPFQRAIPYSALIAAFRGLIGQLLTESNEQIARWREKILGQVGNNGQVIIEVLPQLELILGPQPPVPPLAPQEAQNRLSLVFRQLIEALAQTEHPLVLFLDDLHWADGATLHLIRGILLSGKRPPLLLIGAYRDHELHAGHPLLLLLEEIQQQGTNLTTLTLGPLKLTQVIQLVADSLYQPIEESEPLARLLLKKTSGNPFFIDQLLRSFYQEGLLTFDGGKGRWQWELSQLRQSDITDNVVELMSDKIKALSPECQQRVKMAALIGNTFTSEILALVAGESASQVATTLWEALQEGLVLPLEDHYKFLPNYLPSAQSSLPPPSVSYRFLHDRVQQAAYTMIPALEKQRLHWKIGQLMQQRLGTGKAGPALFDMVNHLNQGAGEALDAKERYRLAEWNQQAAQRAKQAAAFDAAASYLSQASHYLDGAQGDAEQTLHLSVRKEWAECEFLQGNFERANHLLETLLAEVHDPLKRAELYQLRVRVYNTQIRPDEALAVGVEGLAQLGITLPLHPTPEEVAAEERSVRAQRAQYTVADLLEAPEMVDPLTLRVMSLLMTMNPPAYQTNQPLWSLICLKMLNLSLEHGNTTTSPYAYAMQGLNLATRLDYAEAYEYGKLAVDLIDRTNNLALQGSIYFIFSHTINPWQQPFASGAPLFEKSLSALLETGDFVYLSYFVAMNVRLRVAEGLPLPELHEVAMKRLEWIEATRYDFSIALCQANNLFLKALLGLTQSPTSLDTETFTEEDYWAIVGEIPVARAHLYTHKLQLLYLHEAYEAAHEVAMQAEGYYHTPGMIEIADFYFYHALTLTALYPEASPAKQRAYQALLDRYLTQYEAWAEHCPANFRDRHLLLQAEMARIEGDFVGAMGHYDQAIEAAQSHNILPIIALGNELAARFFLSHDKAKIARPYMVDAHYSYTRWGATPKAQLLNQAYPTFQLAAGLNLPYRGRGFTTEGTDSRALDLEMIIHVSQMISSEIELGRLLETLIKIMVQNAGAQRGLLLLVRDGELVVEVEGRLNQEGVSSQPLSRSLSHYETLPLSIIRFTERTHQDVVLSHAIKEGLFTTDPYVLRAQAQSILCTPLFSQGQLMGVLYLENHLIPEAFTAERLEIVRLLGTQAAISIANAQAIAARAEQERVKMEKQLLEQRAQDLAELNASKDKFFSIISHDLRSPFNSLLGLAQIIDLYSETLTREEFQEFAHRIHNSGKKILRLLDNLLQWSRVQTGRMEYHPEPLDFYDLVERNRRLLNDMAEEKEIQLLNRVPEGTRVYGDPFMLDTVIRNLLANAVKFTHAGGHISLTARLWRRKMEVAVQDSGVGIPPEDISKLFRFDEAYTTLGTQQERGTGLGLVLCKELVEHHGGRIWVESTQGQGSTFKFTLPLDAPDPLLEGGA